ncbi:hypothetical protein AAV32_17285 [Kerstersia gyiorum]|uniref:Uncharacterized protein n=1 Tax=Kerstersia gyiorum TaxID=206506 RepID=A0A171KN35_9BURK|nr:hypothetical protein AAV32_17285 [Kerstersia gyiorum]
MRAWYGQCRIFFQYGNDFCFKEKEIAECTAGPTGPAFAQAARARQVGDTRGWYARRSFSRATQDMMGKLPVMLESGGNP